jgi:peptidoglycan-associated lipoprotein
VKETAQPQQKTASQERVNNKLADKKVLQETVVSKGSGKTEDLDSLRLMKEMQARLKDIRLDFDVYATRNNERPKLREFADMLRKNSRLKVTIEGNCDDSGTNEYNLALGDRRANAAKDFLLSLGIPAGRMDTVSSGEAIAVCTEENEACWAKNRRDHFVLN